MFDVRCLMFDVQGLGFRVLDSRCSMFGFVLCDLGLGRLGVAFRIWEFWVAGFWCERIFPLLNTFVILSMCVFAHDCVNESIYFVRQSVSAWTVIVSRVCRVRRTVSMLP